MTNIQIFNSPEFGEVRTTTHNSEIAFVAKDVLERLGYTDLTNIGKAIEHVPIEWKDRESIPTPSGIQEMWVLTEQGLYFFLARSNKPLAIPYQKWIAGEVVPVIRKHGYYASPAAEFHRLHEQIDRLEDENYHMRQRVSGLANGHGSFQLWDVAQQLRKNGIGNGNLHKLITLMVDHGLLMKDTSIKKRTFYRPFLKDIRAGYFDHELTHNGQPVPVWKSDITVTARGLDWIIKMFLLLRDRKWERERPMIRHSREAQRRLAEIPPEAGGTVLVSDELGNDQWIN